MRNIRFSIVVIFCTLCGMVSAQEYVDLGLSVKWCTRNAGTSVDEPHGDYYRWADAMAISTTDGSRMGTKAEWEELRKYCKWEWTVRDSIEGYLVTSNVKGYKGKSIFLPAAGWLRNGLPEAHGSYAAYWSSTQGVQPDDEAAYALNFKRGFSEWHSENRLSEQQTRMVMPLSGKEITKLTLETGKLNMQQGSTARLSVSMSRGKRNVNSAATWNSSDEKVVSVMDDGLIVAIAPGKCTVTVQAYGKSAECAVTVTPHEMEFVDLGLGVLWATCNIGASSPSDYGNYYAWAELEPKEFYSWEKYRYRSFDDQNGMDKYTAEGYSHQNLKADKLERLEPMDDVASVISGGKWHMPTSDDFEELVSGCEYQKETLNGVQGVRFTSTIPGYEGRSIFIPMAGCMNGNEPTELGEQLFVWSASAGVGNQGSFLNTQNERLLIDDDELSELSAEMIEKIKNAVYTGVNGYESRFVGMSVRPVMSLDDDMFTSLTFTDDNQDLYFGQVKRIQVKMMPANRLVKDKNVTWSSSDPGVAAFADGFLTAVGKGNCIITAESGGYKAEMAVSVTLPVPEPVDLGLSVMWASANLGSSIPEEPGAYFMWGETSPKAGLYTGDKYKFGQYVNATTKYNFYTNSWGGSDYPLDYKETLDPEDDAAVVLLGDGWRMPTANELWELGTKCTWKEVTVMEDSTEYGIFRRLLGYVITSNVPGYEDRSIYLPANGFMSEYMGRDDSEPRSNIGDIYYWTSTLDQSVGRSNRRYNGFGIRPVKDFPESEKRGKVEPDPVKPLKHNAQVDLGLSVLWADCNVGADNPEEQGASFAWGETKPKTYYSDYNYKYMTAYKEANKWWYSKYIPDRERSNDPYKDGKDRLDPEDDAATVNWGGKWRTPTKYEFKELYEKCEWRVDTVNGIKGYRITSMVPGYTQNSIFLPFNSGNGEIGAFTSLYNGFYLTSDLSSDYTERCVVLEFSDYDFGTTDEVDLDSGEGTQRLGGLKMSKIHITGIGRTSDYSVRAVCDK